MLLPQCGQHDRESKPTISEYSKVFNVWGMGKISKTKLISKSDTVCVTSKENESSFVYIGIRAIDQILVMGRVIVGFPEFAVLHITDATEDGEVIGKQKTGRFTNRITNIVDEDIE